MQRLLANHELIVHFASVVGVEETIQKTANTIRNITGAILLHELATPDHVILFASSAECTNHSRMYQRPMKEDNYPTLEIIKRKSLGVSKSEVTSGKLDKWECRSNCQMCGYSTPFGPGMDLPHPRRVIPQFMTDVFMRRPLSVSGGGEQYEHFATVTILCRDCY